MAGGAPGNNANERLDSWKEIAAYLRRDERTVRRWEKTEGLPVHRHSHRLRASVYAYRHELDAWWNNRKPRLETENGPSSKPSRTRLLPWWGVAAAACLAAVLVVSSRRASRESAGTHVTRRVFAEGTADRIPWGSCHDTTSDGRFLSCVFADTGNVGLVDVANAEYRALTSRGSWNEGEWGFGPLFSPDDEQIVYGWRKPAGVLELRAVEVASSAERTLYRTNELKEIEPLAWSPDGEEILVGVETADGAKRFVAVNAADGSDRIVKELGATSTDGASYAPNVEGFAYVKSSATDGYRNLYALSANGEREVRLTDYPARDGHPVWLEQGLFYVSDLSGTNDLWRLPMNGVEPLGDPEVVERDLGRISAVALSESGQFYYLLQTGFVDVFSMRIDPVTGHEVEAPSLAARDYRGTNISPAWSPDGRSLAHISRRGRVNYGPDAMALVIVDLMTGEERVLAPELSFFNGADWSPDGRFISVRGAGLDDEWGDYAVDVETGGLLLLKEGLQGFPEWSVNGRSIFYMRFDNPLGNLRLVRRDIETSEESVMYEADVRPAGVRIARSRSSDRLAIPLKRAASASRVLAIWTPGAGEPREILEMREPDGFVVWDWTPDDRFILVTRVREGSKAVDLMRVPVEGGEPEILHSLDTLRDVSMHPDGKRIAFTAGEPLLELYVLENFLARTGPSRRASRGAVPRSSSLRRTRG